MKKDVYSFDEGFDEENKDFFEDCNFDNPILKSEIDFSNDCNERFKELDDYIFENRYSLKQKDKEIIKWYLDKWGQKIK